MKGVISNIAKIVAQVAVYVKIVMNGDVVNVAPLVKHVEKHCVTIVPKHVMGVMRTTVAIV